MKYWTLLIALLVIVSGGFLPAKTSGRNAVGLMVSKQGVEGQHKNQVIHKPKKISKRKKLFGTFAYKGVTLSFAKSIIDMKSGQVGFKIPVTPNFPVYDSRVYLPRITYFIGIAFPLHLKMSLSVTVHLVVLLQGLKLLQRLVRKDLPKLEPLKLANSKDEIKRVGFNINVKIDGRGVRSNIGPACAYLPDYATVVKLIPLVLVFPVFFINILNTLLFWLDFFVPSGAVKDSMAADASRLYDSKEYHQKMEEEKHQKQKARHKSSLRRKLLGDIPLGWLGLVTTWQRASAWMAAKKPAFQITLGQYWGLSDISRSSNLVFDLQPFYPFASQWQSLLSAVSAAIVPSNSSSIESDKHE